MDSEFLIFGKPSLGKEETEAVAKVIQSGWIGRGPQVTEFEKKFSAYIGVSESVAVNSCTSALHLSLIAAGVQAGDEVITTAMTFCATINAIIYTGATPVLVDIDADSYNLDVSQIEKKITSKTKAIVVVHFAGNPCDLSPVQALAKKHHLKVIEDAAHALESVYRGEKIGTLSDFTCFSFYSTKNITSVEGGMITVKDPQTLLLLRSLLNQGLDSDAWKRHGSNEYRPTLVNRLGFKYNQTDVNACIALEQLKKLPTFYSSRKKIAEYYHQSLKDLPLQQPQIYLNDNSQHSYHLYPVLIKDNPKVSRDEFIAKMLKGGFGIGVHYFGVAYHPYYQKQFGFKVDDYPHTKYYSERTVSLPLSNAMSLDDAKNVVKFVSKLF